MGNLVRTKTDAVDAQVIARFVREKQPPCFVLPSDLHAEIKELSRQRGRLQVDLGAVRNSLHRMLDLVFPEFPTLVSDPTSDRALKLLKLYPTARRMARKEPEELARVQYDGRHTIGLELAEKPVTLAKKSVSQHHGMAHELNVRQLIAQAELLKAQIEEIEQLLSEALDDDEIGRLLRTIPGVGDVTAAVLIGELGDFSLFPSVEKLVAYVGVRWLEPLREANPQPCPNVQGGVAHLAPCSLSGSLERYPLQSRHPGLLPAACRRREAQEACTRGLHAQALAHPLLRRHKGQALRATTRDTKGLTEHHGILV
ncbi:Transposase [compost metagenome]